MSTSDPIKALRQAIEDEAARPELDRDYGCKGCGQWMPHGHRERHAHLEGCPVARDVAERKATWKARALAALEAIERASADGADAQSAASRPANVDVALSMCREAKGEATLPTPMCWDLALYVQRLENAAPATAAAHPDTVRLEWLFERLRHQVTGMTREDIDRTRAAEGHKPFVPSRSMSEDERAAVDFYVQNPSAALFDIGRRMNAAAQPREPREAQVIPPQAPEPIPALVDTLEAWGNAPTKSGDVLVPSLLLRAAAALRHVSGLRPPVADPSGDR